MKNEKVKIGFNQTSFEVTETRVKAIEGDLQTLAREIHKVGIDLIDIPTLLNDPLNTLLPSMSKLFIEMAGNITDLKLLNWNDRRPLIDLCRQLVSKNDVVNLLHYYSIADGRATLRPEMMEELKEQNTIYAANEKQAKVFALVSKAVDSLNEANKIHPFVNWYYTKGDLAKPFVDRSGLYEVDLKFINSIL
jgi:hypothetical protein